MIARTIPVGGMRAVVALRGLVNREDAFGVHSEKKGYAALRQALSQNRLLDHLLGKTRIGSYALSADDAARWGVIDADKGGTTPILDFRDTLQRLGIPFAVEKSKSKGYHVWILLEEPAPAWKVRALLLAVAKAAGWPTLEVFPKQNRLAECSHKSPLGNFVNLPWHGLLTDGSSSATATRFLDIERGWRPHEDQLAFLETLPRVTGAQLDAALAVLGVSGPGAPPGQAKGEAETLRLEPGEIARLLAGVGDGERHNAALKLAGHFAALLGPPRRDEIEAILRQWCDRCTPPADWGEVLEVISHAVEAESEKRKGGGQTGTEGVGPILKHLSDVEAESIAWLWPGRIPFGKLTIIVGDPGVGKSFLTHDLAARVSVGAAWPDGDAAICGTVIILTAEDGLADTVRPRVDVMGGDPSRVLILEGVRITGDGAMVPFTLARDIPQLESAIEQTGAKLVIIDPLSAYLGKTDSKTDAEVRGVLAPLAKLAEKWGVAIVAIMHLTKDAQRRAISRALGSIGFVAAARAVFAVAFEDAARDRRVFVPVKLNIATEPPGLGFRVRAEAGQTARVLWDADPVTLDAEAALAGPGLPEERAERAEAKAFLCDVLQGGEVAAKEVFRAARAQGIADRTLMRAKAGLGVRSRHEGRPGTGGAWYWSLAGGSPKDATPEEVASFGQVAEIKAENPLTSPKNATSQGMASFDGILRGDAGGPPPPEEPEGAQPELPLPPGREEGVQPKAPMSPKGYPASWDEVVE